MDKMPLISIIFYSVPEAYLLFTFGMVILGQKINMTRVIGSVILFVALTYIIRLLPLPYGFHTLINTIALIVIFKWILALNFKKALAATLISGGTLIAIENIALLIIQLEFNLHLKEMWKNPFIRTLAGWPHLIIWAFITWVIWKKRITFIQEA